MTGCNSRGWLLSGLLLVLGCAGQGESAGADGLDDGGAAGGTAGDDGDDGDGDDGDDGDDASASVGPTGGGETATSCDGETECDDGDTCTTDTCEAHGELGGTCAHASIEGCGGEGGSDPGDLDGEDDPETPVPGGPEGPIDAACADGGHQPPVFLPYEPLGAVDLPASCDGGFEWQVCASSLVLDSAGGSAAGSLVVDLATYTAPDRLRIVGERADGTSYVLMDTCRVRTAEYADPTDGHTRPPEDSIRRFELALEAGTRSLTIDSTEATTPYYLRVLGLCAFDLDAEGETCGTYRTAG